jgi:cytochrome c-type biogenesis protein CcmH/NrfF
VIALWCMLALGQDAPPPASTEPSALIVPAAQDVPPTAAAPSEASATAPATLPEAFGPPGPPRTGADLERVARETSLGIRCPSCQGLSVAESPANSAQTMNRRIYDLIEAGYSQEQVEAYFVSRYGEWVLLDPPIRGFSWVLWLVPVGGIGAVFAWAFAVALRWREEEEFEGPTEEHFPRDPFEQRILEEIE